MYIMICRSVNRRWRCVIDGMLYSLYCRALGAAPASASARADMIKTIMYYRLKHGNYVDLQIEEDPMSPQYVQRLYLLLDLYYNKFPLKSDALSLLHGLMLKLHAPVHKYRQQVFGDAPSITYAAKFLSSQLNALLPFGRFRAMCNIYKLQISEAKYIFSDLVKINADSDVLQRTTDVLPLGQLIDLIQAQAHESDMACAKTIWRMLTVESRDSILALAEAYYAR